MSDILDKLLSEEKELQFTSFSEETAWQIGCKLVEKAQNSKLPISIDINMANRQLFHASLPGAAIDNDEWIKRKKRLVYRFGHSSYYISRNLANRGKTIEEAHLLSESEYAPHGGCFPVIIKNSGLVGTITVSGLPQKDDHELVTSVIRAFLKGE